MEFVPAENSRLSKEQAKKYGEAISALMSAKNGLTPKDVVDAATPEESPLHDYFEWDDTVAAGLYRETQAKELLRFVHTPVVASVGETQTMRVFHSVSTSDGPRYVGLETISANPDYRNQIIAEAYRELTIWKMKYQLYSEFAIVFQAIEQLAV